MLGNLCNDMPIEVRVPSFQWSAIELPSVPLMLSCARDPVTLSKPVAKIKICEGQTHIMHI